LKLFSNAERAAAVEWVSESAQKAS